MSKIWAMINMKGGVSKSSSVVNLAVELSRPPYNLKVLCIDNDAQGSLSIMFGVEGEKLHKTIADVLISYNKKENTTMEDVMLKISDNLYLIPANIDLAAADIFIQKDGSADREEILGKALRPLIEQHNFDIVFIDNQPSLSLLPLNALTCADYVIVPCSTEYAAYRGLTLINSTLERVKESLNPNLKMFGVIASRHKTRNLHNKEILELLQQNFNVVGVVPESTSMPDSLYHQSRAVVCSAPTSKPALAYKQIAKSIYEQIMNDR